MLWRRSSDGGGPASLEEPRAAKAAGVRDLPGPRLEVIEAHDLDFSPCLLEGSRFQPALLWGADLSGARLQGACFDEALLHRCCLRGVVAAGSPWRQAHLVEADFRSGLDQLTDLGGADFSGADLSVARLDGAQLG